MTDTAQPDRGHHLTLHPFSKCQEPKKLDYHVYLVVGIILGVIIVIFLCVIIVLVIYKTFVQDCACKKAGKLARDAKKYRAEILEMPDS